MNLLDFLFPKRCVGCGRVGRYICCSCCEHIRYTEYQVCPVCLRAAMGGVTHPRCRTPHGLDGMAAAFPFYGVIRKGLHQLKYRYVSDLTVTIVDLVLDELPVTLPPFDLLIPVPLHRKRFQSRGFNQSALLAKEIGKRWQVPVSQDELVRIKQTQPQFQLHKSERKTNMLGVFAWQGKRDIGGKTIALVDDVATTAATVGECAKILKRQGAAVVWAVVVAHG